jgi:sialate O-acetylesterase
MKKLILFLSGLILFSSANAAVRLPKIISDNMVLQRNKNVTLWGWADAGEKISVLFNQQSKSTKADKQGKWFVTLSAEVAGGPYQLTIQGKNTITLSNIMVGEVWVCSGQSNMEWPVAASNHPEEEIKNANYPLIRHFTVAKHVATEPQQDIKDGQWEVCSPQTVADFTAVGYFFAREIHQKLNVPVGLIHTSWGGTHSETWTSRKAFEQSAEFKEMISTMPTIDLPVLAKQRQQSLEKKMLALGITLPATGVENWKSAKYYDDAWRTMALPNRWEEQGLDGFDGNVWFRKTIVIDAVDAGKQATIELGEIDDSDDTYVNGILVGSMKARYNEKRKYVIPEGVLKTGTNSVAVRVEDFGGGGGLWGNANDMKLTTFSSKSIDLAGNWRYNIESALKTEGVNPNDYPTLLFNAMLYPVTGYTIAGCLWYQGESNAGRAYQYRQAFPLLIQDWRNHFKQGDVPFYFVQLASFNAAKRTSETGSTWAELREAQTMALKLPNTGMAVTTDIGDATDIHPRNKQDVGKRLAALALKRSYNQAGVDSGPMFSSMKVEGNRIRIQFSETGSGLVAKDKYGYVRGFEIAGHNQKFHYAQAFIEGNEVIVLAESVSAPVAVRYAWADNPEDANLFNREGFPASPFRTDTWKGVTEGLTFKIQQ